MNKNPAPTPRWQLWLLGTIGGIVVAFIALATSGDDPEATRQAGTQIGAWSVRLLLAGVLVAGGWGALRSKRQK